MGFRGQFMGINGTFMGPLRRHVTTHTVYDVIIGGV